ncbi:hypothetical protein M011DRAFT_528085 [Sporormia fimetaria CBS 119925]|uniref:Zn(2)-C6 fungal-type domain-containing protein n=1 Tax=Sporormia fimetaria CBS 119925 TaxID=1340428 RepID=A0A6A6V5Q0_9PLEO|nr:hypothetical protein M011DRAFT_528085 [Sporormia fimetaria CBS 119925]
MSVVSGTASNASPPPARPLNNQQHTRTYQACIPCRRRKVRCDLGPVDNPHDPPCVRCRRESKECFFSATRRKRKGQDGEEIDDALDDYELRNGRKRSRTVPDPIPLPRANSGTYVSQPLTPGGSIGRYEPLRRPSVQPQVHRPHREEDDQQVVNETTGTLQRGEVYSGHDALHLLFEAAGRNGDIAHQRAESSSSHNHPLFGTNGTPGSQTGFASPQGSGPQDGRTHQRTAAEPSIDPNISHGPSHRSQPDSATDPSYAAALQAWSRFRFVRAGWLTAREGIAYVDYFYTYLSPLTPIVVPDYRDHALHGKLLKEEPMLVVTLLTISSRFCKPSTFGAVSRSYHIHEKFWKYLQGMIDRMIFGQEQFGGGFCGAGQQPQSEVNPLSRKGLRTLGTIESLMLLTEWHPRALHFPPGDDDDELCIPDDAEAARAATAKDDGGKGGQRIDSWLEPCWRSDRMCWMLLGNAAALAFEIGVFDDTSEKEFEEANQHLSHATVKAYFRRKNHLKDLLKIYIMQTSGRLGLTSMLPKIEGDSILPTKTPNELYEERISQIRPPPPNLGTRADGQRLPYESVATQHRHAVQDLVLDFWMRIATIMDMGNQKLFPNRRMTRDLLKSGGYEELLRNFQTPLLDWRKSFNLAERVPKQLRCVLVIEYEYTRVYLNSLALQAVVERCTHNTPVQQHAQPPINGTNNVPGPQRNQDGGAIPFSTLVKWYGNDRHYISEVIDASRNVLLAVVDGLYPGDYLRHAPVRTFFRIVSVAIILLKTFALGATEDDVAYSLGLLDRSVEALRTSIVDDVHVGNRFADLVETLSHRIRSRFVRLSATGSAGISRAGSRSPIRAGLQTPAMGPPAHPPHHPQSTQPHQPYTSHQPYAGTTTSVPGSPSMNLTSGRQTPNPLLWGISSEPYDPNSGQHSLMPPPGFTPNGFNDYMSSANSGHGNQYNMNGAYGQDQDWLALPLDPLLNQWGADISQTAMGPDVGGMDMLDILLNLGHPPPSN